MIDKDGRVTAYLANGRLRIAWLNRVDLTDLRPWAGDGMADERLCGAELLGIDMIQDDAIRMVARSQTNVHVFCATAQAPEILTHEKTCDLRDRNSVAAAFVDAIPYLVGASTSWRVNPFSEEPPEEDPIETFIDTCVCFDRVALRAGFLSAVAGYDNDEACLCIVGADGRVQRRKALSKGLPNRVVIARNAAEAPRVAVVYGREITYLSFQGADS